MNKVILIGNVGKTEKKEYNGTNYFLTSVATTKSWKDKDEQWQQKIEWHNVVSKYANCEVGDKVSVEGELTYKKKDDKTYASITNAEIRVVMKKLEKKEEKPIEKREEKVDDFDDEIPF